MLINIHTHFPTRLPGTIEIESVYFGQSKIPSADQRSVGLHPWYLNAGDMDAAFDWLAGQAAEPAVVAIGEAGLDKVCTTPWDLQVLAFQRCVEVSEQVGKPLVLHCVRAFSEIIAFKKAWKPSQTWIFHGFEKNKTTADMLLRAGCKLSFGAGLFRANSPAPESLYTMTSGQFFLETDDSPHTIEDVYLRAAEIRNMSVEDLTRELSERFFELIKNPR